MLLLISEDEDLLLDPITAILKSMGITGVTVAIVLSIALGVMVWPQTSRPGPAMEAQKEISVYYRAAFIVNSAKRVQRLVREGRAREYIVKVETPNYSQHLAMESRRRTAATSIDALARRNGVTTLGWYSTLDNRTTPECRAANGKNFSVLTIPVIGWPGAVHMQCRCKAGPAHRGAKMLDATARLN